MRACLAMDRTVSTVKAPASCMTNGGAPSRGRGPGNAGRRASPPCRRAQGRLQKGCAPLRHDELTSVLHTEASLGQIEISVHIDDRPTAIALRGIPSDRDELLRRTELLSHSTPRIRRTVVRGPDASTRPSSATARGWDPPEYQGDTDSIGRTADRQDPIRELEPEPRIKPRSRVIRPTLAGNPPRRARMSSSVATTVPPRSGRPAGQAMGRSQGHMPVRRTRIFRIPGSR